MIIKQAPEDFKVTELVNLPKESAGDYTYFWLTKRNYTTVRALQQVARALGVSKTRFNFAGTKDKFAVTKQLVSGFKITPEQLQKVKLKDIEVEFLHTGSERVNLGFHEGNHFEIIVRELSKTDLKNIKRIKLLEKGFPNYFDEQRFSTNNVVVGKHLIRGEIRHAVEEILSIDDSAKKLVKEGRWEELANSYDHPHSSERAIASWLITHKNDYAGAFRNLHKKIRMLYIHSYQSALFNKALSAEIKKADYTINIAGEKLKVGSLRNTKKALPGFDTRLGSSSYDKKIKGLLKKDNISLEEFKMPRTPELSAEGNYRPSVIKPTNISFEEGDALTLRFDLPKGAYATMFVKVLFG